MQGINRCKNYFVQQPTIKSTARILPDSAFNQYVSRLFVILNLKF